MGSPLGPTLANAFLCHYKREWLDNFPVHFKPMIFKRYVDDIFVLFSSKEHLQLFVDYMNKQHKCLKFTSEAENDNSFSFLDIKITRHNQQFKTSVYRKPTFSGVFTHYENYFDQTYKKSLIDTLLFRCFSVSHRWSCGKPFWVELVTEFICYVDVLFIDLKGQIIDGKCHWEL